MRTDIILDGTDFSTADFPAANQTPIGYSDLQHIGDTFLCEKGDLKETPTFGIGINKYLKSSGTQLLILRKAVNNELGKDGYTCDTQAYSISDNKLTINFSKIKSLV